VAVAEYTAADGEENDDEPGIIIFHFYSFAGAPEGTPYSIVFNKVHTSGKF
jgi:hypothetical protein